RLIFVPSRPLVQQRLQIKAEPGQGQQEEDQRERIIGPVRQREYAEAGVEPRLRVQQAEQGKGQSGQRELAQDALPDMPEMEVAQFVSQHGFDLVGGQFTQQRIKKNNAL